MQSILPDHLAQIPLIQFVFEDDLLLLMDENSEWFKILHDFPWQDYQEIAVLYYNALYEFNLLPTTAPELTGVARETEEQAKQRHMFERPTMQTDGDQLTPILYQGKTFVPELGCVSAEQVAPGVVPNRLVGRKPKCFFGMLKAFLGATLLNQKPEPEQVDSLLRNNPTFARACGYSPKNRENYEQYSFTHIPSLRKLEQFDQIMTQFGLWDKIKKFQVNDNLVHGVIEMENELAGDTTHYLAFSSFETLEYEDESGKTQKKSQSKTTKNCACKNWEECGHEWILADEGAGSVAKAGGKLYWAHKAAILGFPRQGAILDIIAVTDGASHDGQTLLPHVAHLFDLYPDVQSCVSRVLYDGACDDAQLKRIFEERYQVELKASLNPRRKKDIIKDLPRGIERITPYGNPICLAGHVMDYKGARYEAEKFIYAAPFNEQGESVCTGCPQRNDCCQSTTNGSRTITIPFDRLPHIDSNDPPMAKRFKAIMRRRSSVERMIKRIKCDFSDERLAKRGNASFQAYLDKSLIAYHLLLKHLA